MTVGPGTVPDSPFAGTQTTLFAFSVSQPHRRPWISVRGPGLEQLMAWNPGGPVTRPPATSSISGWRRWQTKQRRRVALLRGEGPCDVELRGQAHDHPRRAWGTAQRDRAELRDEMLLTALTDVVVPSSPW